jgi:hypothetical protein
VSPWGSYLIDGDNDLRRPLGTEEAIDGPQRIRRQHHFFHKNLVNFKRIGDLIDQVAMAS